MYVSMYVRVLCVFCMHVYLFTYVCVNVCAYARVCVHACARVSVGVCPSRYLCSAFCRFTIVQ